MGVDENYRSNKSNNNLNNINILFEIFTLLFGIFTLIFIFSIMIFLLGFMFDVTLLPEIMLKENFYFGLLGLILISFLLSLLFYFY